MRGWRIPIISVSVSILLFIYLVSTYGYVEESIRISIRLSARISFIFFCTAFSASGIQYVWKGPFTFWLLMNRKFMGITFAIIHLIHLGLLAILQLEFHPVFEMADTTSLLGGGGAYVFVVVMLVTSFDNVKSKISNQMWKGIHTVGAYWIAGVFFVSYAKRAVDEWDYVPLLTLLIVALIFRIYKFANKRLSTQPIP